ncbi:MAG TPA: beta-ketoacyl-[acyl-carrier-protein] synthase family protein [Deltaproteobacteria bacterium]|nr:beta-ketoacyl-[acyl-carrier-protein] synthase family protein [Deltaproteobacteria bacterium]
MGEAAVTGVGVVTPLESGRGTGLFWRSLIEGRSAVAPVTLFDASPYGAVAAAQVEGLEGAGADRWFAMMERALDLALRDAGLWGEKGELAGAALVVGTVLGGVLHGERVWREGRREPPPGYSLHSGAKRLAADFGIGGPVTTVSTACASGTDALGLAYRLVADGAVETAVAGGADALCEFALSGFSALGALSPTGVARPFAAGRDGLVLGEGAAFLVLQDGRRAGERGAPVYGRVRGYASRSDANHMTAPDREGRGLARAMEAALAEAGVRRVDYINAHGTGTPYNDAMETRAIKRVFGPAAYDIPVSSVKGAVGHSFGGAGAMEAAICLLAMKDGVLPPTINLDRPDPECDLDYVARGARDRAVRTAMSLSAGFGGQNGVVVFDSGPVHRSPGTKV